LKDKNLSVKVTKVTDFKFNKNESPKKANLKDLKINRSNKAIDNKNINKVNKEFERN